MSDPNVANLPPSERLTPRKRYRAQIRDEIKQVALRQLAESGPSGISMNAIGKQLGVSGPALYRYFAGRADLLAELVIDAYTDLAAAARNAITATSSRTQRARFETCALAYRSWAVAPAPAPAERELWRALGVDLVPTEPARYLEAIGSALRTTAGAPV